MARLRGASLAGSLVAAVSCGRASLYNSSVDLLANAFRADLEVERLGDNLLAEDGDETLESGWAGLEDVPSIGPAIWSFGSRSALTFHLNRARPLRLSVSALPFSYVGSPAPLLGLRLNGRPQMPLPLSSSLGSPVEVELPRAALRIGRNELVFLHPWARRPNEFGATDPRRLAALFTSIRLLDPSDPQGAPENSAGITALEFGSGWADPETFEGAGPGRWLLGTRGIVEFDFTGGVGDLRLSFKALVYQPPSFPPQHLRWFLNGSEIDTRLLVMGWNDISIRVPWGMLRRHRNQLELHAAYTARPRDHEASTDERSLSVAVRELRLRPDIGFLTGDSLAAAGGSLGQPGGTALSYTLLLPPIPRLMLRAEATAPLRFVIQVTCAMGTVSLHDRTVSGRIHLDLPVPCPPGELARLRMAVEGARDGRLSYSRLEVQAKQSFDAWRDQAGQALLSPGRRGPPQTIVIYLVDTLRADRVLPGQELPRIPNLAAFMKQAQRFSNAWAVTSWTKPAVASLLSGLPPEEHGASNELSPLNADVPLLPVILGRAGYRTEAVVTSCFLDPVFGFDRGFDAYAYHCLGGNTPRALVLEDVRRALRLAGDGRLFLYVHTTEPHTPYAPQAATARRPRPTTDQVRQRILMDRMKEALSMRQEPELPVAALRELYDAEVSEADATFGSLMRLLAAQGREEDALVVFLADHGEEFGEHGGLEHGQTLFPEVTRIPLVVKWPDGRLAGTERTDPVTQLDILPTILAATGLPAERSRGWPLQAPPTERVLHLSLQYAGRSDVGLRSGRFLYTRAAERLSGEYLGQPLEYLFDLAADPAATRSLVASLPLETAYLRALSRRRPGAAAKATTAAMDEETIRRLKALGYLQ